MGLYHIANLTPEAKEQGEALVAEDAKVYVIDDAELQRVKDNYPGCHMAKIDDIVRF